MFNASVYRRRREQLVNMMQKGIIFLPGNSELPMNYAANPYPFRQDSTFLYYFGIDLPGMHALIDVDSGDDVIFGREAELSDIIWMGAQPTLEDWKERSGVSMALDLSELPGQISKVMKEGRSLHFLPPYRTEHEKLLNELVGSGSLIPSVELIRAVVNQRSVKSGEEIEEIERAHAVTCNMQVTAMQIARPGMSEREVFGKIEGIALAEGAQVSFPIILSVEGQILHNHSHDNIMQEGDLLINDCGAESFEHYAADITRSIPVGGRFTSRQKDIYEIVLNAQLAAIGAMRPGVLFRDVHMLASLTIAGGLKSLGIMKGDEEEAVRKGAHALFFPHGLGHMMGLDVHDMENLGEEYVGYTPSLQRSDQFGLSALRLARKLEPAFVVTVEPGIYFIPALIEKWKTEGRLSEHINYDKLNGYLDFGGVRIEDDVLITDDACRVLGKPIPKSIGDVEVACQG